MLAFGAKLGDSSRLPGEIGFASPVVRSKTAIRYTFPAPCAIAIFLPSKLTDARALYSPLKVMRVASPPFGEA